MPEVNKDSFNFTALPCLGRCISTSITAFMLSLVVIVCCVKLSAPIVVAILLSLILSSLNIILAVNFAKNLNSKVTIGESEISQVQYSKKVAIRYDSITDVTVKFSPLVKNPPLVTIYNGDEKISFDTTSKIYDAFKENCKNENAIAMLRKALKKHFIYD